MREKDYLLISNQLIELSSSFLFGKGGGGCNQKFSVTMIQIELKIVKFFKKKYVHKGSFRYMYTNETRKIAPPPLTLN